MPRLRATLALIGVLVIAGVVLNFDTLLLHLGSHLPGDPDHAANSLLQVWWPLFSTRQPDELVIHSFIGAPYLSNHLRIMPLLAASLFGALQGLLGAVLTFNALLIISQIATHASLYAFLRAKSIPPILAALGATAVVLSPWYASAIAQADLIVAGMWVLPVALMAWERWRAQPAPGRAAGVVLVLYAAVLSGVQHIAWIVTLWLPYAAWSARDLWKPAPGDDHTSRAPAREQLPIAVLAFTALLFIYPMPVVVRSLQGYEAPYSVVLLTHSIRSVPGWVLRTGPAAFALAILTVFLARQTREGILWLVLGAINALIGLGILPDLLSLVPGILDLPFQPLADRSFYFGLALIALVSYTCHTWAGSWQALARPAQQWGLAAGVLLLLALTGIPSLKAVPHHPVGVPYFYEAIAAEPEDYLLLEYPFGLVSITDGTSVGSHAYLARYAVWHHKRTLSGVAPYYPPRVIQKSEETPFLNPDTLPGDDRSRQQAAEALGVAVREGRIGYVIVHADLLPAAAQSTVDDLADRSGELCPAVTRGDLIIYQARWHPSGCTLP